MKRLARLAGLLVGAAGFLAGSPLVTSLPDKIKTIVLTISAAILAANGELVKNNHKAQG